MKLSIFSSMEAKATRRMSSPRHPPLHTCGVAVLMIAHCAYTRSQDFNGPIGFITRAISKFDKLATPIICTMQYQWLVMLSFSDNCILAIERILETIFPPSSRAFNKIDKVLQFIESMPRKFDDAMKKFTMSRDQVSLQDRALVYAVSWLNFCSTKLTHWRSEEKEIIMDSKSNQCNMESTSSSSSSPTSSTSPSENGSSSPLGFQSKGKIPPIPESLPTTYKEALEKGSRKEKKDKKEDGRVDCCAKSNAREDQKGTKKKNNHHDPMEDTKKDDHVLQEEDEKGEKIGLDHQACEYLCRSDPILDMFESGWLTKSSKEARETRMSLSSSFIG